ncbi:glycosyltransferase family 4 protein [Flavobacterium undicola]|uniref:glycosyltransferase family 4 protein n=1 Tax=Flavobacterium undicola TaxID=1932779 RepID=UPI001376D957|nr:glycosyltransferase family 4 protein [Flavobacterium undicola]MBA0884739.1 glycosyltransferase family 4 protein [Flavobacterium undicola]
MHIAFLTPEFPHAKVAHAAGIGTSIKNLTSAFVKEGVVVTVFVYGQKTQEIIVENGIAIHLIKGRKYKCFGWLFHRKHIENYCKSVMKKEKIDLIEAPDWTGITAFMNFKIPLVIRFHGSDTYFCHLEHRRQKMKNFWFEKLAVLGADAFIAPTTFTGELSKKLFQLKNKRIQTIHHGLDLDRFENKAAEQYEKGLILYVGTLIRKKGVFELPAIFNKVREQFPEAHLLLIGGDAADVQSGSVSTWELMQQQFNPADLKNVHYLGKIPYDEVQQYMKKAQICVFPTFAETLGMVTIEAMAMQKVVVNSDFGWAKELILDGESGFLVHPANHDLYAERILQLLQNNALCQRIGEQARTRVEEKFDSSNLVKKNIEFYQKLILAKL